MPFLTFYNPFAVLPPPIGITRISHNKQLHLDQKRQEKGWYIGNLLSTPFQRYLSSGLMRCWPSSDV